MAMNGKGVLKIFFLPQKQRRLIGSSWPEKWRQRQAFWSSAYIIRIEVDDQSLAERDACQEIA